MPEIYKQTYEVIQFLATKRTLERVATVANYDTVQSSKWTLLALVRLTT